MKFSRRQFLHLAAGAATLPAVPRIGMAQTYPAKPVRIIVGFAAGGVTDIVARLMGQRLSERLGQQFLVENRTGAGTNIATEAVVNAAPDGYTLLLATSSNAINATLYQKLNFNFIRDIAPVAGIVDAPLVMEVHPSIPANTVPEFIAYAKANPGKINMASGGIGSAPHVAGELFKMMANVNLIHVPYRGSAPALTEMIGGQVQVMFDTVPTSIEYIRSGKLRALAATTATRLDVLPTFPPSAIFCRASRRAHGKGSADPRTHPLRSSAG
jgi:tripartite-type tricarboxylate transporter receptor subunit TctC